MLETKLGTDTAYKARLMSGDTVWRTFPTTLISSKLMLRLCGQETQEEGLERGEVRTVR